MLAEYHRKLHDLREKLARPPLAAELVDAGHRAVVAACGYITKDFKPAEVPNYTEGRDRDDDMIIHTAMLGRAAVIVSNDTKHVSLDPEGTTEYSADDGHVAQAMTFEYFAANHLDIDLDAIDGRLLPQVHAATGS